MISQTAEYALRAAVVLGGSPGRPLTTQRIAEEARVPASYLAKVLQGLGRAGLVEAQRGLRGGFVLARPATDVTVLEVINAVDPIRRVESCPLGRPEHRTALCPLHRRLDDGIGLLERLYRGTTLDELIDRSAPAGSSGAAAGAEGGPLCGGGVCMSASRPGQDSGAAGRFDPQPSARSLAGAGAAGPSPLPQ